jgi:hypothetical protein
MSLLNTPHAPCWHVKDDDRTHGAYGVGLQRFVTETRLVCCECGVAIRHARDDSPHDREERHEQLRRASPAIDMEER